MLALPSVPLVLSVSKDPLIYRLAVKERSGLGFAPHE